jgi:hypothetical protein
MQQTPSRVHKIARDRATKEQNMQTIEACIHCACGAQPVRLKRQWVHHFRDTGQIVVCTGVGLKPSS